MQEVMEVKTVSSFKADEFVNIVRKYPEIREYIDHVEKGIPLRKIARRDGVHPSTVLRRVRKIEARRDDPLLDDIYLKSVTKPYLM